MPKFGNDANDAVVAAAEPVAMAAFAVCVENRRAQGRLIEDAIEDSACMWSIAISLKRIADQLDGSAKGLNLWDMANGVYGKVMDRY